MLARIDLTTYARRAGLGHPVQADALLTSWYAGSRKPSFAFARKAPGLLASPGPCGWSFVSSVMLDEDDCGDLCFSRLSEVVEVVRGCKPKF